MDSYLNQDDQVDKDSVAYQDLFGGQAMLSLVTLALPPMLVWADQRNWVSRGMVKAENLRPPHGTSDPTAIASADAARA